MSSANTNIYADIELPPPSTQHRAPPYVIINMVTSIDGRSAVSGKAASLGGVADRQAMRTLRSKADAVMVGAATLRAEKLSLGLDEEAYSLAGRQPLGVIISASGDLPLDKNLVVHEGQSVLTVRPQHSGGTSATESLVSGPVRTLMAPADPEGHVDLREALKLLAREHGVEVLLVEGGPTLNHALISRGLADELFLTIAPKLLGGDPRESPAILDGPPLKDVGARLLSAHPAQDELFLRYQLAFED